MGDFFINRTTPLSVFLAKKSYKLVRIVYNLLWLGWPVTSRLLSRRPCQFCMTLTAVLVLQWPPKTNLKCHLRKNCNGSDKAKIYLRFSNFVHFLTLKIQQVSRKNHGYFAILEVVKY